MQSLTSDSPVLAGLYIEKLLQVARREGVRVEGVLSRFGLSRDDIYNVQRRFTYRDFYSIVDALEEHGQISGFGFKLGRSEGPVTEGFLGYACISAPSLRHALETYMRYSDFTGLDMRVSFGIKGELACLSFSERYPLGKHIRFSVEELIGHWMTIGEQLRGGRLKCQGASLTYSAPAYAYMYTDLLRCPVSFKEDENQIRFDKELLELPFITSNAAVHQICLSHCETIYRRLAKTGELADEIKRVIVNSPSTPVSLVEMAKQFNMTPRSLRRHLQSENTSYQAILFEVRMSLAADYLTQTAASPREISSWIGYQEVASFYRNFKRWSGITPRQYRERETAPKGASDP